MRALIEAGPLSLTSGGLLRYTTELSLALARCFPDDEFFLASNQPFEMPAGALPNLMRGSGPRNTLQRRWWLWGLNHEAARLRADIVHGPDFAVPYLSRRPSVMTLHDVSPWMDPKWHHAAGRVRSRTPLLLDMGIATIVITPGETVRKQAIDRFRLRPDRVVAIPEAAAQWLKPAPVEPSAAESGRYFLFVGTLEPRKNLPALVEAWRDLRRHHEIDLVIAGRARADAPAIPQEPGLRVIGEVPDADLPALYSGALAMVYPSFYEGFGLPVLEAMQCGCPVIASRAVVEAGGDAAIYADAPGELSDAMRALAEQPEMAAKHRALGLARAREFTWERTARQTYAVYQEARKVFGR
jgi:glycosyltransferase involved in cell wall biosynthesis